MNNLKYIKGFYFDFAEYFLTDEKGNSVKLKINYKDNNFIVESDNNINSKFEKEIEKLANSLLGRKSRVNRAEAIKI